MEFPSELKNQIELNTSQWAISELKKASESITKRYKNESGKGKRLVTNKLDAAVYSVVRMPATFAAVYEAISHTLEVVGDEYDIKTLLDVGAGTGAAVWAADCQLELDGITCLEREMEMSALGKEFMKLGSPALKNAEWVSYDISRPEFPYNADLVTAAYVLNELPESQRIDTIKKLWKSANKILIIIEPGTPDGFLQLRKARDILLKDGAHIAAPCPHENRCKISTEDWCHFTARVQRSKLHKMLKGGDSPFEDEKYSYMAFVHTDIKINGSRILRHPYTNKGKISLELCSESENTTAVITKRQGEFFKIVKKLKCGDLLPE